MLFLCPPPLSLRLSLSGWQEGKSKGIEDLKKLVTRGAAGELEKHDEKPILILNSADSYWNLQFSDACLQYFCFTFGYDKGNF